MDSSPRTLEKCVINIQDHGAVGNGTTDDTAAIQAALNLARSAGGATVYVPPGTYRTGPLTLGQRVRLAGAGFRSILRHAGGAGHLLTTYDTAVDLLQIADISLECWPQTSGNAIHLANSASGYSSGYPDTHHSIRDVFIVGPAEAGVFLTNGVREARFVNVVVRDPRGGHGFHVEGTDNFFDVCTVATSRTPFHGFYVHASNNRFVGCKAFYCGQAGQLSDGWYVDRGRNTFVGCEAQDCGRWGFHFTGSVEVTTAVGLLADSNASGGIVVDNSSGNVRGLSLSGFTTFSRTNGRYLQPIGIRFVGNPTGGSFVGTARNNTSKDVDGSPTGASVLVTGATGDLGQRITGPALALDGDLRVRSASTGGGAGVVALANATQAPTSNPSGGGVLYAENGNLRWRASSGVVFDSSRFVSGTGTPEGIVSAPVGTTYIDTAVTTGAVMWLKVSGTGATGWQVHHGDTGRRDVKALLTMTNQLPYSELVYLRRVGATVMFTAGFKLQATAPPSPVQIITLPAGFRPQAALTYGPRSYANLQVVWRGTGRIDIYAGSPGLIDRVSNTFLTNDPWPATLPGTAAP
jgi:Pectate lyase superfamily protein